MQQRIGHLNVYIWYLSGHSENANADGKCVPGKERVGDRKIGQDWNDIIKAEHLLRENNSHRNCDIPDSCLSVQTGRSS